MENITISIDREVWKDLMRIKIEKDFKTLEDIIKHLLENQK